jgi:hypothetical protein
MTKEEQEQLVRNLCDTIIERIRSGDACDSYWRLGVDKWPNYETNHYDAAKNGTATYVFHLNGGAVSVRYPTDVSRLKQDA